jgi:hypothetical protein
MALEVANYIDELVAANPAAADQVSQADDHLRLIKTVLLQSFPNISDAVTATDVEINTWEDRITDLEDFTLQAFYDLIHPLGQVQLFVIDDDPNLALPAGIVATWTQIGADYFIKTVAAGAGDTNADSLATVLDGAHAHGAVTGDHTLLEAELPVITIGANEAGVYAANPGGGGTKGYAVLDGNKNLVHGADIDTIGGGGAHSHSITADVGHTHAMAGEPASVEVCMWYRSV